jgi:C-terminal processing protease CtpA/Prc
VEIRIVVIAGLKLRVDVRSGIIRIHDAIVKIDDEDIQGQPLPVISSLIAGQQGSFVVIAFRRMTGKEIFYYDVELERGSPDYFSSMDASGQGSFTDLSNPDNLRAWAADYKNIVKDIAW